MFRELLAILVWSDPAAEMGETLDLMFGQADRLVALAGACLLDAPPGPQALAAIQEMDRELNRAERRIRKRIIVHLVNGDSGGRVLYALLLMNVVRDLERVGDYAKNVSQIYQDGGAPVPPVGDPEGDVVRELRREVEAMSRAVGPVFMDSAPEEAAGWLRRGKELCRRSDELIGRVAGGDRDSATTTTLVLAARYYKRMAAHMMNMLTGVVMPLHKLDFYDESVIDALDREDAVESFGS